MLNSTLVNTVTEDQPTSCGRCGSPLARGASQESCARCLLTTALRTLTLTDEAVEEMETPAILLERRNFGEYELLSELGRGGMGVVFKARQKQPDRCVALKVVASGELATPRMLSRFRLEAKAAAGLHHPNIVPIFEVGNWSGWHFFSMQLIEGPTLADILRKGRMNPEAAVQLLLSITRAVDHAHQRGILHRDIKPTNILIDSAGEPHLTDFGLAKVLDQGSELTISRAILGTPAYMSPEQADGRNHDITMAADVYGIGALFYEMLTGQPPFVASTAQALLRRVIEEDPVPPSKLGERKKRPSGDERSVATRAGNQRTPIPRDLEVMCLKCLEKVPARRYASAGELAAELERWQRHEPILARPSSPGESMLKWVRRHPARAGLLATVLLATLIIVVGGWVFNLRLHRARLAAEQQATQNLAQVIEEHIHECSSFALRADALSSLHSLDEALQISARFPNRHDNLRLRAGLVSSFSPRPLRAWDAGGSPTRLGFSADGDILRVTLRTAPPRLFRINDPAPSSRWELFEGDRPTRGVHFSRDGRRALELRDAPPFARLRDITTGGVTTLAADGPCGPAGAFSPDDRIVATGGDRIRFWNVQDGRETSSPIDPEESCEWIGFSPDGRRLLSLQTSKKGFLWDVSTGGAVGDAIRADRFGGYFEPVFSQDGSLVLVAEMDRAHLLETESFKLRGTLLHPGVLFDGAFSPDGSAIAIACFRGNARLWNVPALDPMQPQLNHENGARCVAFSPDGQMLATGGFDYQVRLWRRRDRHQMGSALPHAALVTALAFSPDGRMLATASADGLVRVWDLGGGPRTLIARGVPDVPMVYSVDRQAFATAEATNSWRLYQVAAGRVEPGQAIAVSSGAVMDWDRRNARVATAAPNDAIRVWDARTGLELAHFAARGTVRSLQFSPDGTRLAVCGEPAWAGLIALASGEETALPSQPGDAYFSIAWALEGRRIVTGEFERARVWDTTTRLPAGLPVERPGQVHRVQTSPDGRRMVAGFTDDHIEPRVAVMIDAESGRTLPPAMEHGDGVRDSVFSPSGRIVATLGEDNTARLWQTATRLPAGPALRHEAMVRCVAFAPGERCLATGGNDHTLRFWEVATGGLLGPPILFGGPVTSVGFTTDGATVIVGVFDGSVWTVSFSPDSRPLATIQRLALLATAHKLDASGGLIRVPPDALERESSLLAQESPASVRPISDPIEFHQNQAAMAELGDHWFAAVFHLGRLAELTPGDRAIEARRSRARENLETASTVENPLQGR